MNRQALDQLDHRILQILQKEGRLSNHELSQRIALSASACLARVKRLEKNGVITGYRAQVDPSKLGPSLTVFAELTLLENNVANMQKIEFALSKMPELTEAWEVSGRYDILARFLVPDMERWATLSATLVGSGLAVETARAAMAVRRIKFFGGVQPNFGQEPDST